MLKRRGFGAGEIIGGVIALGAAGIVGYSMFSGDCVLGGCDAGSGTSAASPAPATVVGMESVDGSDCSLDGCEDGTTVLASDAQPAPNLTMVKSSRPDGCCEVVESCEASESCESEKGDCPAEKPLD